MRHICQICFFALAFCACAPAQQSQARDVSAIASEVAECARDVALDHLDVVPTPEVAVGIAVDLAKCAEPVLKVRAKAPSK